MSDDKTKKDELVRDALNISGVREEFPEYTKDTCEIPPRFQRVLDTVEADIQAQERNAYGYPQADFNPAIQYEVHGEKAVEALKALEGIEDIRSGVNDRPFHEHNWLLHQLPPDMTREDIQKVTALIRALSLPKPPPVVPKPPEPETDLERRERLFRSAISAYAVQANAYACEVCSHRDLSGRPFPSTPEETSLLMKEGRRLFDQLARDTKDLGYSIEEVHHAANHAEKEVAVQYAEETKPYLPDDSKAVSVLYTDWRGSTLLRRIIPDQVWWGSVPEHDEGWFLSAWDLDLGEMMQFSLSGFPGIIYPALPSSSVRTTGEDKAGS